MFKLDKLKILLIKKYLKNKHCQYISTSKIKKNKTKIFMKAIEALDDEVSRSAPYPSIFLQTLGSGAYGAPQSLFVQSHFDRFLFNCGEGTRRICFDHRIAAEKLTGIFFTSCSWKSISGLPAYQAKLTHSTYKFKLYGPPGLSSFINQYENLDPEFDGLNRCFDLTSEKIIFKKSLIVKALPLISSGLNRLSSKNTLSNCILAYVCTFPSRNVGVSSSKLESAGVPIGPLANVLKNGIPVILSNSKTVTPTEVSTNSYKASTFIVLDIPSHDYLDALVTSSDFDEYKRLEKEKQDECEKNNLEVIVHFSSPEVMKDSRYREWVNSFSPSVSHLVINNKSSCLGLRQPIRLQLQLNQINSKIFPLHRNPGVPFVNTEIDTFTKEEPLNPLLLTSEYQFSGPTVQSNSALLFYVRPYRQFDSSSCPSVNRNQTINFILRDQLLLESLKNLNAKQESFKPMRNDKQQQNFPNVLFLGTGSGWASDLRNVSSILLTLCSESCMLLDCGEGTFSQLVRLLGKNETTSILRKLKLIFLSHKHQDHHMGFNALLTERKNAFLEVGIETLPPLYVFTPPEIMKFLKDIHRCFSLDLQNILLISNVSLVKQKFKSWHYYEAIKSLKLEDILVTFVPHLKNSFGIALRHQDGWKIVYSGDCTRSCDLIDIGKNCDLLIHEATLEDGLEESAKIKRHCTVSQALQVARDMKAKFTILTHFSQRYRYIPFLEGSIFKENVGIAFDNMKVTFEDLPKLRHLYPIFKKIFKDDFNKVTTNNFKRSNFK